MTSAPGRPDRVRAFDWLRGMVIPLMIQCHAFSLLRPELRKTTPVHALGWLDGLVAPAFILTAGFALALVEGRAGIRWKSVWRAFQILLAATLVNWMWFPLFREPRWLFRVDILHCIGLSLGAVLLLLAVLRAHPPLKEPVLFTLSAVPFLAAPLGEQIHGPWAMLANVSSGAVFPLLPWLGYAFLGAGLGVRRAARGDGATVRALWLLAGLGAVLWAVGPLLATLYPPHDFKVTNPAEHARRVLLIALTLIGLLALERRRHPATETWLFRALALFGRTSLVAYVFHEALLYFPIFGFSFFTIWGRKVGWELYWPLTLLLIVLTYAVCWGRDRLGTLARVQPWRALRSRGAVADRG